MRYLILLYGILVFLDSILTEIGIHFLNAIEINPFYHIWVSNLLKISVLSFLIYKRNVFTNKDLIFINIVPLFAVINNSIWIFLTII